MNTTNDAQDTLDVLELQIRCLKAFLDGFEGFDMSFFGICEYDDDGRESPLMAMAHVMCPRDDFYTDEDWRECLSIAHDEELENLSFSLLGHSVGGFSGHSVPDSEIYLWVQDDPYDVYNNVEYKLKELEDQKDEWKNKLI